MNLLVADFRAAQHRSVSNTLYNGLYRCGFGLRYIDSGEYRIYAGANANAVDCSVQNKNYDPVSGDVDMETKKLYGTPDINFFSYGFFPIAFNDIFFEPPDPKTYINNSAALNDPPQQIILSAEGTDCTPGGPQGNKSMCRSICVYTTGRIDTAAGTNCP